MGFRSVGQGRSESVGIVQESWQRSGGKSAFPPERFLLNGITIRHDEAMERDGKPRLTERIDLLRLTQNLRSGGNQKMLAVVGVNVVCEKAFDGT